MGRRDASEGSQDLRDNVGRDFAPAQLAADGFGQADRRIEMRARDRAEDEDEHDEPRAGSKRIAEQRNRDVAACQAFAHDAGADDDGEQKGGAERFGRQATGEIHAVFPISRTAFSSFILSREANGRLTNMQMRRCNWFIASTKA